MSRLPEPPTIVVSSVIASMHDSTAASLALEFRSGAIYRYVAVPPAVVEGLIAAASKGAYFNRYIRTHFPCQRLA